MIVLYTRSNTIIRRLLEVILIDPNFCTKIYDEIGHPRRDLSVVWRKLRERLAKLAQVHKLNKGFISTIR